MNHFYCGLLEKRGGDGELGIWKEGKVDGREEVLGKIKKKDEIKFSHAILGSWELYGYITLRNMEWVGLKIIKLFLSK